MTSVHPYRRSASIATVTLSAALMVALAGPPARAETALVSTPHVWIDGLERAMVARSGRVLTIPANPEAGRDEPLHAVFYAPLATVWILADAEDTEVLVSGSLHRGDAGGGFVTITWDTGSLTTLTDAPPIPDTGSTHELAHLHDALLSRPLATPLDGLPTGSRFAASGIVETPAPSTRDQSTAPDTGGVTLWESLGDYIVITKPDGSHSTIRLQEVVTALKGPGE